ncbi:MAG: anti-phage ZorAB system protein ZorA [Galactobacter sp.]
MLVLEKVTTRMLDLIGQYLQPIIWGILVVDMAILLLMLVKFMTRVNFLRKQSSKYVGELRAILAEIDKGSVQAKKQAKASPSPVAREAWLEYDNTLVKDRTTGEQRSTADAQYFFNSHTLAPNLFEDGALAARPSQLTAVGVLATFLGLSISLLGLQSGDGDVDGLMDGINTLIAGAATTFITSVAGVGSSLWATAYIKAKQRKASAEIAEFETTVDNKFERYSTEAGLIDIGTYTRESAGALAELHEKIGSQFQTAVRGLSTDMEAAMVAAISSSLAPTMDKLADSASKQSSSILENLIEQFSGRLQDAGSSQAAAMNSAASGLTDSVLAITTQVSQSLERMENASRQSNADQAALIDQLRTSARDRMDQERQASSLALSEFRDATAADVAALRQVSEGNAAALNEQRERLPHSSRRLSPSPPRTSSESALKPVSPCLLLPNACNRSLPPWTALPRSSRGPARLPRGTCVNPSPAWPMSRRHTNAP